MRAPCPASCSCRNKVLGYSSYVAQLASQETAAQPAPSPEGEEEPIQELVLQPEPSTSASTSSSSSNPSTSSFHSKQL